MSTDQMAELVRGARSARGLSQTELAALSGVSKSTISRIEAGKLDPTVSVFRSIMSSAGFSMNGPTEAAADPDAVDAATNSFRGVSTPGNPWFERWSRTGLLDGFTFRAVNGERFGQLISAVSSFPARPGAIQLNGPSDTDRVIQVLRDSGVGYVVTGEPAFGGRFSSAPDFYVTDPPAAAEVLRTLDPSNPVTITLVPMPANIETEVVNGVPYATPERALVDLYSSPGDGPEIAGRLVDPVAHGRASEMRLKLYDRALAIAGVEPPRPDARQLRRSLAVHRRIAQKLAAERDAVIGVALSRLPQIRAHTSGGALQYADDWERLLTTRDIEGILKMFSDETFYGSDMRTMSPFAGVLSENEYLEALGVNQQ